MAATLTGAGWAAVAPDGGNSGNGRLGAAVDREAAERGAALYRPACGFCHGGEARGAQGPSLTSSLLVVGDPGGSTLHDFLQVGRPAQGMPPFPQFTPDQVRDIAAFIQQRSEGGRRRDFDPNAILVGDAKAGEAYFNGEGGCATCHSPTGDLRGVGAKYTPMVLQGRMINPKVVARGPGQPANPPLVTVTVTPAGGAPVKGRLVQVNEFFVTFVDEAGLRRTVERNGAEPKVEIDDPLEAHRQQMLKWTDRNMWNVTAYLSSLK